MLKFGFILNKNGLFLKIEKRGYVIDYHDLYLTNVHKLAFGCEDE